MKPDLFGDFLVRFLGVSKMLDDATKPVPRGSAPPAGGALDDARRHMFELRGEARQLIIRLNESAVMLTDDERVFIAACTDLSRAGEFSAPDGRLVAMMPGYPGSCAIVRACGSEIVNAVIRSASLCAREGR